MKKKNKIWICKGKGSEEQEIEKRNGKKRLEAGAGKGGRERTGQQGRNARRKEGNIEG